MTNISGVNATLDRQVKRFVLSDFSPIELGIVRRGAMVAVPVVPIENVSTCGHAPKTPELAAVRAAALAGCCDGCGARWMPIDHRRNSPLLRMNHAAGCPIESALELWMRRVGFTDGLAALVWELAPPGAEEEAR